MDKIAEELVPSGPFLRFEFPGTTKEATLADGELNGLECIVSGSPLKLRPSGALLSSCLSDAGTRRDGTAGPKLYIHDDSYQFYLYKKLYILLDR